MTTTTDSATGGAAFDAIIIGAGISGMYQLHQLRKLGMSVQVIEAGSGVGGTWYWNRYPGARFDSESYSYGYSFSEEILDEWQWSEHFSAQPETLRYCNFVADKLDLRRDIRFNSRVRRAAWDDRAGRWTVFTEDGQAVSGQYLITAIGPLSVPTWPTIDGIDAFQGQSMHTAQWPHEPVSFAGKRVAVIGTGATGVQTIQEVAKTAAHLTVFQRRPNWCAPLKNSPITPEQQVDIRARYPEIFESCRRSHGCFMHDADPRRALGVSEAERNAFYEELYDAPGFGIWMGNFRDIFVSEAANKTISDFVANKIRGRVNDPDTAERLIPSDHGFGTRRLPLETRYFEVYNQDNVRLVDLRDTPITRITETGITTSAEDLDFDMIIYATGFDAVTGGFDRIEFEGLDGQTLKSRWADGPETFLGMMVPGFPNMLTLVGPHNAASFCNIPRCIEQNVEWATDFLRHMRDKGLNRLDADGQAAMEWTQHVHEGADKMLYTKVDSWFMGINSNVEGKNKRTFLLYAAGAPAYRAKCDEVAAAGYAGIALQ